MIVHAEMLLDLARDGDKPLLMQIWHGIRLKTMSSTEGGKHLN